MFGDPNRVATIEDFRTLGQSHAHEFFLLASEGGIAGPGEQGRFLKWMARRIADMAAELREIGASDEHVMAWHDVLVLSYSEHVEERRRLGRGEPAGEPEGLRVDRAGKKSRRRGKGWGRK